MLIARVLAYVRRAASDSWILSGDFIIFFVRLEPADWVVRAKRRGPPSVTTNHRVCWPSPTVEGKKFESFRSSFAVVHQEASTDALWTLAAGRNANREKRIWQLTFFLYWSFLRLMFGWNQRVICWAWEFYTTLAVLSESVCFCMSKPKLATFSS